MYEHASAKLRHWAWWLGFALCLACICNGTGFYLKKLGFWNSAEYDAYWGVHCLGAAQVPVPSHADARALACNGRHPVGQRLPAQAALERQATPGLYVAEGAEVVLKITKDLLAIVAIALSAALMASRRIPVPPLRSCAPMLPLLLILAVGTVRASSTDEWQHTVLGLRSYWFLALALAIGWAAGNMAVIARWVGWLVIFQILLAPLEFMHGMHIHGHFPGTEWPIRMSGTLILPNSLGIFAAGAAAFSLEFEHSARFRAWVQAAALGLVILSGSATGLLAILLVWGMQLGRGFALRQRVLVVLVTFALVAVAVFFLPQLSGRPQVFSSLFGAGGRLGIFEELLRNRGGIEIVFGQGPGAGSNVVRNLFPDSLARIGAADSTVTMLMAQLGLAGLVAFYGLLAWACVRDTIARPFYISVAVTSLTINITELFPINFLLGLALAHTVFARGAPEPAGTRPVP